MVVDGFPGIVHAAVTYLHCVTVEYFAECVAFREVLV